MANDLAIYASSLKSISENALTRTWEHDRLFDVLRSELKSLCDIYADDPINPIFLEKGSRLIGEFDEIEFEKTSGATYSRAKVNAVVTSSRVRRTHFASYLAGKYAMDANIGGDFKCWAYNAAAYSAMQLAVAIEKAIQAMPPDEASRDMLSVFGLSASEEALMYLDFAEDHSSRAVLTQFNKAVLDIRSGDPRRMALGISAMRSLEGPSDSSSSASLSWHESNYRCYIDSYFGIQEAVRTHDGNAAEEIKMRLQMNKENAERIGAKRDQEGGRWKQESPKNRALIAAVMFGGAVAATVFVSPEARDTLFQILSALGNMLATIIPGDGGIASVSMGDGGIAGSLKLASIAFGDGGTA